MEELCSFFKECGMFFVATMDGDQPRVRPFGALNVFEGKLYIQTGKSKDVSKQMAKNSKIEICASKEDKWVRVQATAVNDDRVEAKESMLDQNPSLKEMYSATDDNTQVLYLKDAIATFSTLAGESKEVRF